MKEPVEIFQDGQRWLVTDVSLFRIAYSLAKQGAKAIARASGIIGQSDVDGFNQLELEERRLVVNDARRIHTLINPEREVS